MGISGNFRGDNLKKQIGSDAIVKIVANHGVSAQWLITGEGEMFENRNILQVSEKDKQIERLEMWFRDKEKIIQRLKAELIRQKQ